MNQSKNRKSKIENRKFNLQSPRFAANLQIEELIDAARAASQNAYAPYSHYPVGAAVLTRGGKIFTGCNIENAAYPSGVCAERVAIFKAVSEGARALSAIAVVTPNGASPCGACRQVFSEFAADDARIILALPRGKRRREFSMQEFLPARFGARHLK
ncbi:MAG: cytidine deaminase [Chloroflexi bacterium]|nr:cytidine deaminase [Chloroflexota bacterium]